MLVLKEEMEEFVLRKEAAVHLLISVIFNQSCKSRYAFEVPGKLLQRLDKSFFDLPLMEAEGFGKIYEAIALKPSLHRFPSTMANHTFSFVLKVNRDYSSDPRLIWADRSDTEVLKALMRFDGIGYHKAVQCLLYLCHLGEVHPLSSEYMAYMNESCKDFSVNIERDLMNIIRINNAGLPHAKKLAYAEL